MHAVSRCLQWLFDFQPWVISNFHWFLALTGSFLWNAGSISSFAWDGVETDYSSRSAVYDGKRLCLKRWASWSPGSGEPNVWTHSARKCTDAFLSGLTRAHSKYMWISISNPRSCTSVGYSSQEALRGASKTQQTKYGCSVPFGSSDMTRDW